MPPMPDVPLYGLVLVGGNSSRMGHDKAMLEYHDVPEWRRVLGLLESRTEKAFISVNAAQSNASEFSGVGHVVDRWESIGPMNGIASALGEYPDVAWLVVACDMPNVDDDALGRLSDARNGEYAATVFVDGDDRLEPLCGIYEPSVVEDLLGAIMREDYSLFRCLEGLDVERVLLADTATLKNINTPEESDKYRRHGVN